MYEEMKKIFQESWDIPKAQLSTLVEALKGKEINTKP